MSKSYELVLFGATGITGRQAYRYLAETAPENLRWAIAGRSADRLEALIQEHPPRQSSPEIVVADCEDPASIDAMIRDTEAIVHLAGPYAKHGEPFFSQCVEHGTDYVDIGGETFFLREMILQKRDSPSGVNDILEDDEILSFDIPDIFDHFDRSCAIGPCIALYLDIFIVHRCAVLREHS